jgi:hypothetical protein
VTGSLQRQLVAVCPKPKQAATRNIAEVAVMPKLFPGKRVAQVNLDKRNLNRQECVAQGDTRMRERSGIQDDEIDPIGRGLLHAIDEFMFGVALVADQ